MKIETLENCRVKLVPFKDLDDFDYLYSIMPKYKHNKLSHEQHEKVINKYGRHFWTVYGDGVKGGVIYLSYFNELMWWTLDAYRDHEVSKSVDNKADWSYYAGRLVVDYFFRRIGTDLFTLHTERSRAATIICKRLGFRENGELLTPLGKFVVLYQRKDLIHGS